MQERIKGALEVTDEAYLASLEWRRATRAAALRAFRTVDVLLTPTVASLRKTIGENNVELGGKEVHYIVGKSAFTTLANHLGMPALALPLRGESRPPPSAQVIGPPWSEARLLETGLGMENAGLVTTHKPPHWRPTAIDTNPGRDA